MFHGNLQKQVCTMFHGDLQKQKETQVPEPNSYETTFLLTWLGLGSLIIIEGLALPASGVLLLAKHLAKALTPVGQCMQP
ncbi:hypothetical protein IFM89_010422 [Coptis chinensis]|uniref:Uncharacterized protein n=1 Tax=Coptis chinensis TaxID=261450 RepID=A0A835I3U8_9MAGN|nr:hypothetical protein IFM89_010422 [Coptis chinensis]